MTSYEYGENSGSNLFSDEGFKPTKVIDPKGIVTEMTYDAQFRLLTTKRDGVLQETNEYDADGNVTKKTVHNSTGDQVTEMTYDAFNNLLTTRLKMGGNASDDLVTTTEYSAGGLPVKVTDPAGTVTETAYDGAGRKIRETVKIPGGTDIVTEYAYDANGNVTAVTLKNSAGSGDQVTQTAYDALNRAISVTDPEGNTAHSAYDANGNKVSDTDPAGNVTDCEYDAAGRLVKTVYPAVYDGEAGTDRRPETASVYDRRGQVVASTDVRGTVTVNEYDVLGRLVKSTVQLENSQQLVTENEYDELGNVVSATTWRGAEPLTTVTEYDSFNRPVKVTDPAGNSESCTYDTVGNKLTATDKRGYVTNFTYDRANRLVKTQMPTVNGVRPATTSEYDKAGRVAATTDPNGRTTRSEYDAAGRKLKSIDAANHAIAYSYDSAGNILTQTVAGRVTAYAYDRRNLQLSETLNPGDAVFERVTSNRYDSRGNRTRRIQPDGAVTDYTYDAQNRLLTAVQDGAPAETRSYTYNAAGSITFVAENGRATGYTLDKLGRTVEERTFVKDPLGTNWIPKSVVTSVYDVVGNRLSVTYPNGRSLTSAYDPRNLLTSVSDGVRTTSYGYDAAGNRTSMTMPNGVVASYAFDSNNRLTKIAHRNAAGANLYTAEYTLDAAGIRTAITETGAERANRVLGFSYDNLYQLTQESDSLRNGGAPVVYTYDAMGNRTQKVDNGVTTVYTVDRLNRVTAATTGEEVVTYTCDANGNTATKTAGGVTRAYHYDRENRLVRVSEGGEDIFSAVYDYRSRRLEKHENGDTVSYLYDGGVSVQEYDAEGSLKTALIRAGGYGGGIGDVVYTEKADGSGREYFLYNATGTTSALTDDSGAVTGTSCYTAWGTETAATGETGNVRKFSTKERSELLGIDYFGFRYYDPDLGRFLTRDPSGYPDGPNNYLYCMNSPVNNIDPLGLKTKEQHDEELLLQWQEGIAQQRARRMEGVTIQESSERTLQDYISAPANLLLTGNSFPSHKESAQAYNTVVDDYKTGKMNKRGSETALASADLALAGAEMAAGVGVTTGTYGLGVVGGAYLATDGTSRGSAALSRLMNVYTGGTNVYDPVGDAFNAVAGEKYGSTLRDVTTMTAGLGPFVNRMAAGYYASKEMGQMQQAFQDSSGRLVIGRMKDLNNLGPNEYTLPGRNLLPDLGNPKANWMQNSSQLRNVMRQGLPIRDASLPDATPVPTATFPNRTIRQTFTGAERNLLRNRGWVFDGNTKLWSPPNNQ